MKSGTEVSEFPVFSWMLLEVNPCVQDSRTPRQSQMLSVGEVGREGLVYKTGWVWDPASHLDLWAAEQIAQ